jgi:NAD(P)-dependent dehydrogenase (short-subunit alcohol dehydrogenase family)
MPGAMPLTGHVAIVTGAASGLGRAHAHALAALGARIIINDLPSSKQAAGGVADNIVAAGGEAVSELVSASDPDAGDRLVDAAMRAFGRLDIVVSNAGVLRAGLFPDVSDEQWRLHVSVHLDGAFRLARAAWPALRAQDYGRIVFTTSSAGLFGAHGLTAYAAAKMGVVGLVKVLALEAGNRGIRVNAVAPLAWTPMSSAGGRTGSAAQILGTRFEQFSPDCASQVVALLCHPECPANGQIFAAGGGRVAEVVVAESTGYQATSPSWTDLLAHWDQVCARESLSVPRDLRDELAMYATSPADR